MWYALEFIDTENLGIGWNMKVQALMSFFDLTCHYDIRLYVKCQLEWTLMLILQMEHL